MEQLSLFSPPCPDEKSSPRLDPSLPYLPPSYGPWIENRCKDLDKKDAVSSGLAVKINDYVIPVEIETEDYIRIILEDGSVRENVGTHFLFTNERRHYYFQLITHFSIRKREEAK